MKKIEAMQLFQPLYPLIKNGIVLNDALMILITQTKQTALKNILIQLKTLITAGNSFSKSLSHFPAIFSAMDCALAQVGEESGQLAKLIHTAIGFRIQHKKIKAQIKKALFYPMIVLITAIAITMGLLIFIIPQFQAVFSSFNTPLPWLTQMVIQLSDFLKANGVFIALLSLLLIAAICFGYKKSKKVRAFFQKILLGFPVLGKLIHQTNTSLCCTILAVTHESGIPLLTGIKLAKQATTYLSWQDKLNECEQRLAQGDAFSKTWEQLQLINPDAMALLTVGENTGQLGEMLKTLAEDSHEKTQQVINYLSQLIEPVTMIILSVITGGLIIAMYLPIFNISAAIQ